MKPVRSFAAVAIFASIPMAAAAQTPGFHAAYSAQGYTLSAQCDLTQPIAFITVNMSNTEPQPTPAFTIAATDSYGALHGTAPVPSLRGGDTASVVVPLRYTDVPRNPQPAAGLYQMTVTLFDRALPQLPVAIPSSLCPPGTRSVAVPVRGAASHGAAARAAAQRPAVEGHVVPFDQSVTAKGGAISQALRITVPRNVHAAVGAQECAAHVGLLASLVCPDMIKSGNVLLAWDWQADGGPDAIDGFRVYRVDGTRHQLVATQANKNNVTLADLPKPAGGFAGTCYAVAAYAGSRESAVSDPFCGDGGAVAKTVQLQASHARSSSRIKFDAGNPLTGQYGTGGLTGLVVGFFYEETKHTFGDSVHNAISRTAVSFDTGTLLVRRIVSARLKMHVAQTAGADANHSCATTIGSGTGTWWQNKDWIEVQPAGSVAPTDAAPQISADVTPFVAAWLRGEKNFGLVLWNDGENLGAFTNARCETAYDNPVLEVTYY